MLKSVGTGVGAGLLVLGMAFLAQGGAQEKTKGMKVGTLGFSVPESWEEAKVTSAMRKMQLKVPGTEGDKDAGELALFLFPTGAGTVQANIDRWAKQFQTPSGEAAAAESKVVKGQNLDVTRVEVAGTYVDPFSNKGPQANYRLLGAIAETPGGAYFFKLVGPDKTIQAAEGGFDGMISSMKVEGQ